MRPTQIAPVMATNSSRYRLTWMGSVLASMMRSDGNVMLLDPRARPSECVKKGEWHSGESSAGTEDCHHFGLLVCGHGIISGLRISWTDPRTRFP